LIEGIEVYGEPTTGEGKQEGGGGTKQTASKSTGIGGTFTFIPMEAILPFIVFA
jgi:hypothetical protein